MSASPLLRSIYRGLCAGMLLLVVGGTSMAQTTTLTLKPNDGSGTLNDIFDLDHHYLYTWRIDSASLTSLSGRTITGATLKIKNIRNWNSDPNVLHIHMFDTVKNAGVWSFVDDNTSNSNVTDHTDDFINTRYHNGTNANGQAAAWGIAAGTSSVKLANPSFTTTATNYSLDLAATGFLDELGEYILNGMNVGFGFDADCHFFNDGISLEIQSTPGGNIVPRIPEPTTALLLLGGLPLLGRVAVRRRRK
jgi:hypothetical protein